MVERLQVKACSIGKILSNLEKKYTSSYEKESDAIKKSPSGSLGYPPNKRAHLKIQSIPPFNASKVRNSPSSESTKDTESIATEPQSTEPDISELPEDTENE